jgi:nitroreductase
MNVLEAIKSKRAVRKFKAEPVPEAIIEQILNAGRRSQSSKNTQPWQFVLVQNRDTLHALSQTGDFAGHLAGASFAVALVGQSDKTWNAFDLGQAAAYMQLAAWELGIGSVIAAIYDQPKGRAILGIPDDLSFYCALSFGYPSPEDVPARMGGRRPLDELVHREKW